MREVCRVCVAKFSTSAEEADLERQRIASGTSEALKESDAGADGEVVETEVEIVRCWAADRFSLCFAPYARLREEPDARFSEAGQARTTSRRRGEDMVAEGHRSLLTVGPPNNDGCCMAFGRSSAAALGIVALCALTIVDTWLDGGVLMELANDPILSIAIPLTLAMVLPQLVVWRMLRMGWCSLLRMLLLPSMLLGYRWLPRRLQHVAPLLLCGTLEPFFQLWRCLALGRPLTEQLWLGAASGLLQAPCSFALTLHALMLGVRAPNWLLATSLTSSLLSATVQATRLHFYGMQPTMCGRVTFGVLVKLPQVASRLLALALVAFLCRPPTGADTLREDLTESTQRLLLLYLAADICMNMVLLRLLSARFRFGVHLVLGVLMTVSGPPGFLLAMDRAQAPDAVKHAVLMALMAGIALQTSPPGSQRMSALWNQYPQALVAFLVVAPWSLAASLMTARSEGHNLAAFVEESQEKLHMAIQSFDPIMSGLLMTVDGVEPKISAKQRWIVSGLCHCQRTLTGEELKWDGIAAYGEQLFCAPCNADDVLVVDAQRGTTATIATGIQGYAKWSGIAVLGDELYCAPSDADDVLVISPATGSTRLLRLGAEGSAKWSGITALGGHLYCAPCNADSVLVIDAGKQTVTTIPCGIRGVPSKWAGIATWGNRLYCAPCNSDDVLVIHPDEGVVSLIPTGVRGHLKWAGIAAWGNRLFCAPRNADDVLVIDPEQGVTSFIRTGSQGQLQKWGGMAQLGDRLYCAPHNADAVLCIDPVRGVTEEGPLDADADGRRKWDDIVALGGRLYCGPMSADRVLEISDDMVALKALRVWD